jgi:hypothetical protein
MNEGPKVDVCIGIDEDCAIDYMITREYNEVDFRFGGPGDGFHYIFDIVALRRFLEVGARAVAEIEARPTELADAHG